MEFSGAGRALPCAARPSVRLLRASVLSQFTAAACSIGVRRRFPGLRDPSA